MAHTANGDSTVVDVGRLTKPLPNRAGKPVRVGALHDGRNRRASTVPREGATEPPAPPPPPKLIRFPVVRERTGLSRSTIWRLERRGAFPRHYRIAPNVVAWLDEELTAWIQAKRTRGDVERDERVSHVPTVTDAEVST